MAWEEHLERMKALVADSLAVPTEGVEPRCSLIDDLGADSLDFVDILFQIEKKFGVKIRSQELNALAGFDPSAPASARAALTPETLGKLKELLPTLDLAGDPASLTPAKIVALISVETLCRMVEKKRLETGAASPAS